MPALHLTILLAAAWSVFGLAFQLWRVRRFGSRRLYARPAGTPGQGALYAFTKGMSPGAKESVRENPGWYLAGIALHAGLAAGFLLAAAALAGYEPPPEMLTVAGGLAAAGVAGGTALLGKRMLQKPMRAISCPDDFIANGLSTAFAALALATLRYPALQPVWFGEMVLLLVYIPLGKIRHCLFFFTTRYHFGAFYGRRGTFPPPARRS